jgi:hypothetical protein
MVKRIVVVALSVVLALSLATPMALGQVGQGASASGTAAELAAAWWEWALEKPAATNPLVGSYTGGEQCNGQPLSDTQGKKWFLGGSLAQDPVVRTCTMPVGTQLFFPIVNLVIFPDPGETEEHLRAQANRDLDAQLAGATVEVTVDGKNVNPKRRVRAISSLFEVTVPAGGLVPAGEYQLLAAGLWATLPPLPPGEHTIHFEITGGSFDQDVTYHLTVVNGKRAR